MIISSVSHYCRVVEGSDALDSIPASLCSWAEFFAGAWVISSLSTLGALAEGDIL